MKQKDVDSLIDTLERNTRCFDLEESIRRNLMISDEKTARIAQLESDLATARKERDDALARTAQVERIVKAMNKWLEDNQEDVFRRGIWDAILEAQDERGKG